MPTGLIIIAVFFLLCAIFNIVYFLASSLPEQLQDIQEQLYSLKRDIEMAKEQIDDLSCDEDYEDFDDSDEYTAEIEEIFHHIFDEFSIDSCYRLQNEWQLMQKEIIQEFKDDAWRGVAELLREKHGNKEIADNDIEEIRLLSYADFSNKLDNLINEDKEFKELEALVETMQYTGEWDRDILLQCFIEITHNFLNSVGDILQETYQKYNDEDLLDEIEELEHIHELLTTIDSEQLDAGRNIHSRLASFYLIGSKELEKFPPKLSHILAATILLLGGIGVFVGGIVGWLFMAGAFSYFILKESHAIFLIKSTAKEQPDFSPPIILYVKHLVRIVLLLAACSYLFSDDIYHYFGIQSAPIVVFLVIPVFIILTELFLHNTLKDVKT